MANPLIIRDSASRAAGLVGASYEVIPLPLRGLSHLIAMPSVTTSHIEFELRIPQSQRRRRPRSAWSLQRILVREPGPKNPPRFD